MMVQGANEGKPNAAKPWPPSWLPILAVIAVLIAWPFIGFGARQAWLKCQNRVEDWLPPSFAETRSLESFFRRFGSDEFLIVSWEGSVIGDARTQQLATQLVTPTPDGHRYFDQAFSGSDMLELLRSNHRSLTEGALKGRLSGLFIGKDGKQNCVIGLVSRAGLDDRRAAVEWAWTTSETVTGLKRDAIHLAGSTVDSVAVDQASSNSLTELNLLSMFLCFTILLISLRSFWLVGTLFVGALFNETLSLAIIYYSGGHVDSVLLLVANLAFVLTLSAGLHYLGYFRDAVRDHDVSPARTALRACFVTSLLAAVTTAIGFISLCTSEITPIRRFGIYAAIVVPINSFLIIVLLSIHSTWATRRSWRWKRIEPVSPDQSPQHWSRPLVSLLDRSPLGLLSVWIVLVAAMGFGVLFLTTSVGTHKLLPKSDRLIRDYAWLEDRIGPLVPIELVLRFPKTSEQSTIDRLRLVDGLRRDLNRVPEVQCSWSVMNVLPPLPDGTGLRNTVAKSAFNKAVSNSLEKFREMRLLYEDDEEQSWRISGRVSGTGLTDYEALLVNVSTVVADFRERAQDESLQVEVSGGVPFVFRTQRQLMQDLLNSFTSAFVMIAATMALLFRSLSAGLLSMLPNVTPGAVVFGMMGWLGLEVELGTVLTASVIMGVCVDDTLHLITHFRMLRDKGLSPADAVEDALSNCGGAMLQTALVCGLGMLVFAFSPFTPISRFAWLTFSLLMIGLISDLILTPAILLSPLNRAFYHRPSTKTETTERARVSAGATS